MLSDRVEEFIKENGFDPRKEVICISKGIAGINGGYAVDPMMVNGERVIRKFPRKHKEEYFRNGWEEIQVKPKAEAPKTKSTRGRKKRSE